MVDETELIRPRSTAIARRSTSWCGGPTSISYTLAVRLTGTRRTHATWSRTPISGPGRASASSAATRSSAPGCTGSPRTARRRTCRGAAALAPSRCSRASSRPTSATRPSPRRWPRRTLDLAQIARAVDELPPKLRAVVVLQRRLRAAPRGDRRGARDLGVGGEGPAPPGPASGSGTRCSRRRGRPVRYEDVADLIPGLVDGTVRGRRPRPARSSSRTCAARPSWPGTAGCSAALEHAADHATSNPRPGVLAPDADRAGRGGASAGSRARSSPAGAWSCAGAALGGAAVAGAATAAVIAARSRRRLLAG